MKKLPPPPNKKKSTGKLEQIELGGMPPPSWVTTWKGMPEYICEDLSPYKSITIHFATTADMLAFGELIGQKISMATRSTWFPKAPMDKVAYLRYIDGVASTTTHYFEWQKDEGKTVDDIPRELPLDIQEEVLAYKDFFELLTTCKECGEAGTETDVYGYCKECAKHHK